MAADDQKQQGFGVAECSGVLLMILWTAPFWLIPVMIILHALNPSAPAPPSEDRYYDAPIGRTYGGDTY